MMLHAGLVGQRVVVRCFVKGQTGPSGGPAFTDVLGVLEEWTDEVISVRRKTGETVLIRHDSIATAKPVPPRASVRHRISADSLERVCAAGWQAPTTEALGDWLLRAGGGFTGRANSTLIAGDPSRPLPQALEEVQTFYSRHQLPALAQVIVDSPWLDRLTDCGWIKARPGEGDALVQVASVSQARRVGRSRPDTPEPVVEVSDHLTADWMERYGRTAGLDDSIVRAILTSGDKVAFAHAGHPARAIGRAVLTGDWVGLSAVEVDECHRGSGLGSAVVDVLLEWAASLGATSAYLQTLGGNVGALALYRDYGFTTHHSYRYLRPPDTHTTAAAGA